MNKLAKYSIQTTTVEHSFNASSTNQSQFRYATLETEALAEIMFEINAQTSIVFSWMSGVHY